MAVVKAGAQPEGTDANLGFAAVLRKHLQICLQRSACEKRADMLII